MKSILIHLGVWVKLLWSKTDRIIARIKLIIDFTLLTGEELFQIPQWICLRQRFCHLTKGLIFILSLIVFTISCFVRILIDILIAIIALVDIKTFLIKWQVLNQHYLLAIVHAVRRLTIIDSSMTALQGLFLVRALLTNTGLVSGIRLSFLFLQE